MKFTQKTGLFALLFLAQALMAFETQKDQIKTGGGPRQRPL
jgi:hypothetical protein